jgi:diamine N-acetyltransferase
MTGAQPFLPARPPAFRAEHYELAAADLRLSPITPGEAEMLGTALAAIDPWARYGTTATNLSALFRPSVDGGIRLAVRPVGETAPIGVVVVRHPWLVGPYLQFLALLPAAQGHGHGAHLLGWYEAEARAGGARNIWICAAAFNTGALRLYLRCGFTQVAVLDSLIQPGIDEILMRKKLAVLP